jgi:hypothetical protein
VALAIRHISVLFFGQSEDEPEPVPVLNRAALLRVRSKFAMTCLLHNLGGLPGQDEAWYIEALLSAQSYMGEAATRQRAGRTTKPAPVTVTPADMPARRGRPLATAAS